LRPWYTDTITRCVRVLDVLKHGGGLHFGFICIDALYVLTHQRLALYLINKLDDGRKVGRPMARVLKGPVRSRNGVDRHARGHMGAALARTLVDVLSSMKWPTMAHLHSRTWSAQQVQTVLNM